MDEPADDSQHGSDLLRLLGILVGSFASLQTVIPIFSPAGLLAIWIAKICWGKFQVNRWVRFWSGTPVVVLCLLSGQAHQATSKAVVAEVRRNALNPSPKEKVEAKKMIQEQTFAALLLDPQKWRCWRSWNGTKQTLEQADSEWMCVPLEGSKAGFGQVARTL